ncbi:hypothetical protein AB0B21_20470 [Streptomyces rimosus]|uniref:hypothetical protein n=1 Tax=Streptomyces rimosus TaxID=1927 RepID=UPI0004C72BE0|nr:hypothetical protein [Streptomyces rimosus]
MGLFSRKNEDDDTPEIDPKLAELGREYAIARRHHDRRAMNRIAREVGLGDDMTDDERASFQAGRRAYDDIPPAYSTRRNRRR